MLSLLDARTGSYAEVRPGRPGLLRVCAHPPEFAAGAGISGLRVLLVSDLLARTAELRGLQVLTVLAFRSQVSGQWAAAERAAGVLGIHPPAGRVEAGGSLSALGGPIDVHVVSHGTSGDGAWSGMVVEVGAVHLDQAVGRAEGATADLLGDDRDPLSVRLGLMSFLYQEPADLTRGILASADEELIGWRRRVAEWAESPSRPVPPRITETVEVAFGKLDTVSVLLLLRGLVPDADVPAGAKFEAFVYADRILGLDLARDIGRSAS